MSEALVTPAPAAPELCLSKAKECRDLAREAASEPARIMFTHIAETWERAGNLHAGASVDVKA